MSAFDYAAPIITGESIDQFNMRSAMMNLVNGQVYRDAIKLELMKGDEIAGQEPYIVLRHFITGTEPFTVDKTVQAALWPFHFVTRRGTIFAFETKLLSLLAAGLRDGALHDLSILHERHYCVLISLFCFTYDEVPIPEYRNFAIQIACTEALDSATDFTRPRETVYRPLPALSNLVSWTGFFEVLSEINHYIELQYNSNNIRWDQARQLPIVRHLQTVMGRAPDQQRGNENQDESAQVRPCTDSPVESALAEFVDVAEMYPRSPGPSLNFLQSLRRRATRFDQQ